MAWYWYLLMVGLAFNVGFVCGAWLGGSRANGSLRMKDLVARFVRAGVDREEELRVQKVSA